jgi:hypothetical protein
VFDSLSHSYSLCNSTSSHRDSIFFNLEIPQLLTMGPVEVLESHDLAYFTVFLVDIHKSGKKIL